MIILVYSNTFYLSLVSKVYRPKKMRRNEVKEKKKEKRRKSEMKL